MVSYNYSLPPYTVINNCEQQQKCETKGYGERDKESTDNRGAGAGDRESADLETRLTAASLLLRSCLAISIRSMSLLNSLASIVFLAMARVRRPSCR